jgi:glutathione gamma-glutamylcysteinyltransferase
LPEDAIAFSSADGRRIFAEALAARGLDGYFPLAEQFHTQSDPAFCGLGSLVVALNALAIDPERLWKGPWRWFAEDLLDCCVPLEHVRERGIDVDELACLARCNGAEVEVQRAEGDSFDAWHAALAIAASGEAVVIASYDRKAIGQTGSGHFSPVGGYHAARDLALVLDVARFKYPPHWVQADRLWRAMQSVDPSTGRARGWMVMRRRMGAAGLGFNVSCVGESWPGLARRLMAVMAELHAAPNLQALATAVRPLAAHLEVRPASEKEHREAVAVARAAVRDSAAYSSVLDAVGHEHAEAVTVLLFAVADRLTTEQRRQLGTLDASVSQELDNLRAQLEALSAQSR